MKITYGTGLVIKGRTPETDFSLSSTVVQGSLVGTGVTDYKDIKTSSSTLSGGKTQLVPKGGILYSGGFTYESLNPLVGTVDVSGVVTRLQSGTIDVLVKGSSSTRKYSDDASPPPTYFYGYNGPSGVANTVLKAIHSSVASAVAGKTPDTSARIDAFYNGTGQSHQTYLKRDGSSNPDRLYYNIDFSSLSVSDSRGILISPRHYLTAAHTHGGDSYQFKLNDGSGQIITAFDMNPGSPAGQIGGSDIFIKYLDDSLVAAIAAGKIKLIKTLPTNYRSYMPGNHQQEFNNVPEGINPYPYVSIKVRWKTHTVWGLPADNEDINHDGTLRVFIIQSNLQKTHIDYGFSNSWTSNNDSGSCTFYILDISGVQTPILRCTLQGGGPIGNGPLPIDYETEVNAMMNSLASAKGDNTVYALQKVSFAQYATV